MTPVKKDFIVYKGDTWRKGFQWKVKDSDTPMDLTDCIIKMQIKLCSDDTTAVLELSTTGSGIVISEPATDGKFTVTMLATDTAAFEFNQAVYDLEIKFPSGDVFTIIAGKIIARTEVTK